jgi:hypothetical protein
MSGGMIWDLKSAAPFATNGPALTKRDGTNFPIEGYAYDTTTQEQVALKGRLVGYTSGNITLDIDWYADTATTNGIVLGCQLACVTPGDAINWETKSLATAQVSATSNASGTSHGPVRATITITNLDSAAADDVFVIKLYRDVAAGGDTMAGDAILILATAQWS